MKVLTMQTEYGRVLFPITSVLWICRGWDPATGKEKLRMHLDGMPMEVTIDNTDYNVIKRMMEEL